MYYVHTQHRSKVLYCIVLYCIDVALCTTTYIAPGFSYMSRITRTPTVCTLRKVSTLIMVNMPDRHFSPPVDFLFKESLLYISIPLRLNVSARMSLCGLRRLIWIDILRRDYNVGFLTERLIYRLENLSRHEHSQ